MNFGYGGPMRPGYPDPTDYNDNDGASFHFSGTSQKLDRIMAWISIFLDVVLTTAVLWALFFTPHPIFIPIVMLIVGVFVIGSIFESICESGIAPICYYVTLVINIILIVVFNCIR